MAGADNTSVQPDTTRRLVLFAIFALGVSCVMTQLALMREMLSAFAGNEMVLGVVLGLWLLLMGLGTALGRMTDKLRNPLAALLAAQIFVAVIPLAQVFAVRALRNVVFVRGAEVGVTGTVLSAAVLLLPYCVVAGFMLTLACAIQARFVVHSTFCSGDETCSRRREEAEALTSGRFRLVTSAATASAAGRVYVADSLGSIAGGVLFTFVLLRWLDHFALLSVPALLNLTVAAWLAWRMRPQRAAGILPVESTTTKHAADVLPAETCQRDAGSTLLLASSLTFLAAVVLFLSINPDGVSTVLQFPGQRVLFRANSPYGRLVVTESAGQISFIENGVAVVSTPNVEQVEESAHYAMAQRPDARRVLLVSGGVAGVAREILKYKVAAVDCVELDPLIVKAGQRFLPGNLADSRIRVVMTDGRRFIRQAGAGFIRWGEITGEPPLKRNPTGLDGSRVRSPHLPEANETTPHQPEANETTPRQPEANETTSANRYDIVILALPDPSTAQLNRFFTTEFFGEVKRVLADGGVLSFALGRYENYVSPELARLLASAHQSLKQSFANVLVLPGGRVFFLASDGSLHVDIAARIKQRDVVTKLVNRHYLDAMLTADRMADIQSAVSQPAAVNRDFSPMLYFYHLRHWMSQFKVSFGVLQAVLLVLLLIYLVRLRGPALVLFASGFAGSALEIVLLLALQVLCGSLYQQVGVVVTLFMAGLAVGAAVANREAFVFSGEASLGVRSSAFRRPGATEPPEGGTPNQANAARSESAPCQRQARRLSCLAFGVAAFAALLPLLLPTLNPLGRSGVGDLAVQAVIGLLTFALAVLVGAQFPLANRMEFDGTNRAASRLYTADFVGAFLGALLASTLLIPLLGVTGVCLLTAVLNLVAGGVILFGKAPT